MDPEHNPFFRHAEADHFIAFAGDDAVGRVAAVHNRLHNEIHEDRVGFFGLFECIDDPQAARALLDRAREWLATRGLDVIRGPMNYSTNDTCGLLIDGAPGTPYVMMPHNPRYYRRLVEGCGFRKARDLLAYVLTDDRSFEPYFQRIERSIARRSNARTRSLRKRDWAKEVEVIRSIYNRAWEKNWGFVPFTPEEFDHMAREMKPLVDPNLVAILELDGEPIGFGLALPDANLALGKANGRLFPFGLLKILWASRKIDRVRVPILGVLPEQRGRGYDALLYAHIIREGMKRGHHTCEMSWLLEDNAAIRQGLERIGGRLHRTYRVFERSVR